MNRKVKRFFRRLKPSYYILFVLVVGLGLFNVITAIHPKAQQERRERTIERLFDSWWEEKGAAQFIAVGLKADEKTRQEEFDQFRERYLKQNHTFIVEDRIAEMRKAAARNSTSKTTTFIPTKRYSKTNRGNGSRTTPTSTLDTVWLLSPRTENT